MFLIKEQDREREKEDRASEREKNREREKRERDGGGEIPREMERERENYLVREIFRQTQLKAFRVPRACYACVNEQAWCSRR